MTKKIAQISIIPILIMILFLLISSVLAQEGETGDISDDQVNAIAKQLYCPSCENIPLDVCPTQACRQWRELIREKLALGWSEKEVKDYFVAQYGDRVLASPPARGLNWLIYVIPVILIIGGIFFLVRTVVSWQSSPTAGEVEIEEVDSEYASRLEKELDKK